MPVPRCAARPAARVLRRPVRLALTAALAAVAGGVLGGGICHAQSTATRGTVGVPELAPDDGVARLRADVRAMISKARDRVFPSLVNIEVVSLTYSGGKEEKGRSTGSGTIISADGYVLTNAHVTEDGHLFWCVLADKQRVGATLVGEDPWTDLAVLKIDPARLAEGAGAGGNGKSLPAAAFGNSDELDVGDYVLAMGSPFALSRTVTLGVVSNTERVFTSMRDAGEVDEMLLNWEQRTGLFTNWIQHDALINPGNSGGPLVNLVGEIIGVNTRGGSGMAFATPSNLARAVAEQLIAKGEVSRSSVGASFRHLQRTGLSEGVLVDSVDTEGPAHAAGLRAGDVITAIDGTPITVRFAEEIPPLLRRISDMPIGTALAVTYRRGGEAGATQTARITTEKLLKDKGDEAALRNWGVTAQQITPRAAKQRRLTSTKGALVSSTRAGGPAATAEPELDWGDVILRVDDREIPDLKALVEQYTRIDAMKDKPEYVLVEFERRGKNFLTLIKPKPEDRRDPPPELPKAWVGVATQPVTKNLADKLGLGEQRGFRVMRVYSGTKAAEAGLKVGDVIVGINDTKLVPKGLQDAGLLNREIRRMAIDDTATLKVVRDGAAQELPVTLEKTRMTAEEAPRERSRDFELVVRDLTFFDREDNRWPDDLTGVYVDSVENAGWAGLGGVDAGDVIQKIGEHEVTDTKSFKAAMESITKAQPDRIVFVVFRGSRTFFRFVEPEWKPVTKEGATQAAAKQ